MTTEQELKYKLFNLKIKVIRTKEQLASTDYQAIKFAEGEISAEDYEPIKLQRKAWREDINHYEELIQSLSEQSEDKD